MTMQKVFDYATRIEGFGQWLDMSSANVVAGVLDDISLPMHDDKVRMLDVGTAAGRLPGFINETFLDVATFGTDLSASDILAADSTLPFAQAKIEKLPFADDSFDLSTAMHVLEHTNDPIEGIQELTRVTALGGVIVAAYPKEPIRGLFALPSARRMGGGMALARKLHLHALRPKYFDDASKDLGLTVVGHHYLGFAQKTMPQFVSVMKVTEK